MAGNQEPLEHQQPPHCANSVSGGLSETEYVDKDVCNSMGTAQGQSTWQLSSIKTEEITAIAFLALVTILWLMVCDSVI